MLTFYKLPREGHIFCIQMHGNLCQHTNTFSIHFYINSFIFRPKCQTPEVKVVCPTTQLNIPIKKTNDTNYHDKLHRCSQLVLVNTQRFTPWLTTLTLCSVRPRGACKFGTFQNSGINNFDNSGGSEDRGHIYMTRKVC